MNVDFTKIVEAEKEEMIDSARTEIEENGYSEMEFDYYTVARIDSLS